MIWGTFSSRLLRAFAARHFCRHDVGRYPHIARSVVRDERRYFAPLADFGPTMGDIAPRVDSFATLIYV